MKTKAISISPIPAFNDNYIWLIRADGPECAIVDPGDHRPVLELLEKSGFDLKYILLTHHHADHIGGVSGLLRKYPATVIGPSDTRISGLSRIVSEGDEVLLPEFDLNFKILEIPGHTSSHIAFVGHGMVFCGDTLFSIGCGRLFEGTADQMQMSLDKIAALAPETLVYCAHEYTRSNCAFALGIEPENKALLARSQRADKERENGNATIPSTLSEELAANPFLRTRQDSIVAAARKYQADVSPGAATLAVIRTLKDRF